MIQILSQPNSWLYRYIPDLSNTIKATIRTNPSRIKKGKYLFVLGWHSILPKLPVELPLGIHLSALPKGRGWAPLTWGVLESNEINISLFKIEKKVDTGDIYERDKIVLEGHELLEEIRKKAYRHIKKMIVNFLQYPAMRIRGKQKGKPTYYSKRTPKDSEIDIHKPLIKQFTLLRVADNKNYPIYFMHKGYKYILTIKKEV